MFVDLAWPTWTLTAIGHNLRIHCAPNMIRFSNANHPFDGRLNTWRKAWRQPTASRDDVSATEPNIESALFQFLTGFRPRVSPPLLLLHRSSNGCRSTYCTDWNTRRVQTFTEKFRCVFFTMWCQIVSCVLLHIKHIVPDSYYLQKFIHNH